MQIFLLTLALISDLIVALPFNDGRGATICTLTDLRGASTAIPANAYCTDLDNIFGNFDGHVRSVQVEAGHQCRFHLDHGCLMIKDRYIVLGSANSPYSLGSLPQGWDSAIHSVYCT
ncbi:hypothetical protein GQ44DRAFT_828020 [Phaeosphaeriaceae sp. PMI808]|nr:hypothetical protein GQ44DRAFT_828020 [Phaeosphaeriaceae sp. PMI808]